MKTIAQQRGSRVLVVDAGGEHGALHDVLVAAPWVERIEIVTGGARAEEAAARLQPDVAVVAGAAAATADAACERVRRASRATRVLLVARGEPEPDRARAAGAAGVVSAEWPPDDVAGAVRLVALGMTVYPTGSAEAGEMLSERELAVLRLMAAGATNPEIAERLYLSPHTVKDHTTALYRKLRARNRAEAVARAQRHGLLG